MKNFAFIRTSILLAVVTASVSSPTQAAEPASAAAEPATASSPFGRFDRNGDGRLTEEEMRNGMAGIYAAHDKNNDGTLDSTELPKLKDVEGKDILNENATTIEALIGEASTIFAKLDRDGDGFLSADEFSSAGGKPADAM